jgi:hypothetical protein
MGNLKYSDYFGPIVALVTHLASCSYGSRTPSRLALELALPRPVVIKVLNGFPELFRRSIKTAQKTGENFYTVHLRYARRKAAAKARTPPLTADELSALLDLVTKQVEREAESVKSFMTGMFATFCAVIAAVAAIIAATFKS